VSEPLLSLDLLAELSHLPGLPGREQAVAELIQRSLPAGWESSVDALGNLVASRGDEGRRPGVGRPSRKRRVMLMAHMDEVGLIVRRITPQGFLLVERLGGMGIRALPGNCLTLWTAGGPLPAVTGTPPQHLDERAPLEISQVYVDIGASSREEALRMGAHVGDGLTWKASLQHLTGGLVCGKALDDRAGCFALLSLAHWLESQGLAQDCELLLAFVVQEEAILAGGVPAVQALQPEIVIGVDSTLAFDTPDLLGQQSEIALGRGPALKWMDAIRGKMGAFVPSWELAQRTRSLAEEHGIPLQDEVVTGITTAISPVVYAVPGMQAVALSIPLRYHHSPVEMVALEDLKNTVLLLAQMVGDFSG
jgi:putative aminopeptidase